MLQVTLMFDLDVLPLFEEAILDSETCQQIVHNVSYQASRQVLDMIEFATRMPVRDVRSYQKLARINKIVKE
jgi:hypothetical protein